MIRDGVGVCVGYEKVNSPVGYEKVNSLRGDMMNIHPTEVTICKYRYKATICCLV